MSQEVTSNDIINTTGDRAMPYPTIIPAAISSNWCDTAAAELKNTVAVIEQDSSAELELTTTCADIAREAHKVSLSAFFRPP